MIIDLTAYAAGANCNKSAFITRMFIKKKAKSSFERMREHLE